MAHKRPYALCCYESGEMAEKAKEMYAARFVVDGVEGDLSVAMRIKS